MQVLEWLTDEIYQLCELYITTGKVDSFRRSLQTDKKKNAFCEDNMYPSIRDILSAPNLLER
jgi:hypothetical protein